MQLPRLLLLVALASSLSSCATYTRFRVTNFRGHLLSEWVAKGPIHRCEGGYEITAVEHLSGPPYSTLAKYPDGWRATVIGPHIVHWRVEKPEWLAERE